MKRIVKAIFCLLLCITAMCALLAAEAPEFSLDLGNNYLYFREGESLEKAAEITGMSEEELNSLFEEEGLLMLVLSEDNTKQIRVACYENEISEKIGDFSNRSYDEVRELSAELFDDFALGGTLVAKDTIQSDAASVDKYMTYSELHTDSGGDYMVTQYITVVDGAFWHIMTYAPNHSNIPDIMPYFTVGEQSGDASKIFYAIGALFAVLAVVALVLYLREKNTQGKSKKGFIENEEKDF